MNSNPVLRTLLLPAAAAFGGAVRLRAWLYGRGIFRQRRLRSVVISVGNLTVGGTGKTPLVIWLAERLRAEGKRVGILTRGYRGSGGSSDEVDLLRCRLSNRVPIGVGSDRYAQGCELERQGIDYFILDDGLQHLRLARNVDIVVLDATDPFGSGSLLPAGRLREPKSALARADVLVITRREHSPALEASVRSHTQAPIFYAQTQLEGVFGFDQALEGSGKALDEARRNWRQLRLYAFCGIGNPAAFFGDLRRWGANVVAEEPFPDHYPYNAQIPHRLVREAKARGAEALICTEKDVSNLIRAGARFEQLPVLYCRISLGISDGDAFWQAILAALHRKQAVARG